MYVPLVVNFIFWITWYESQSAAHPEEAYESAWAMQHAAFMIESYEKGLTSEEQVQFRNFCDLSIKTREENSNSSAAPDPIDIASCVGINLADLNKLSPLGPHVWIAFLSIYAEVHENNQCILYTHKIIC